MCQQSNKEHHVISSLKIPSKTFLFGEYSVLQGAPAYVLAHEPFFHVDNNLKSVELHEKSPAGILLLNHNEKPVISLVDPHDKKGGFGRSTAEFISAASKLEKEFNTKELYDEYISIFSKDITKPSGADLVTQASGSSVLFNKEPFMATEIEWPFVETSILICHTNNKVDTHKHLNKDLSTIDFSLLNEISNKLSESLKKHDFECFLSHLKSFSNEQNQLGLVHDNTIKVTAELNKADEVLFARGCGALGADVVAILVNKNIDISDLSYSFKELNLDLICTI